MRSPISPWPALSRPPIRRASARRMTQQPRLTSKSKAPRSKNCGASFLLASTMADLDLTNHHLAQQPEAVDALRSIHNTIESLNSRLISYYEGNHDFYTTDFLVFAVTKRTLSMGRAFLAMIAIPNFGVAAALLRMQLDTALRFSAMALVESPTKFASDILGDLRIDKMRSRTGQRLTDRYLVQRLSASASAPWIERVYEETSGFIHLSGRHMYQTFESLNETDRTVKFVMSAEDVSRPPSAYIEIVTAFDATTGLIVSLLTSWLDTRPKN